ncbi:unnamed protein product [Auanema sp. JU1783]|nr:unnamed protein product [Auanema sp. JU1783]
MLRYLLVALLVSTVTAVDREKFKSCSKSAFCKRQRDRTDKSVYKVLTESIKLNDTSLTAQIKNEDTELKLTIVSLKDSIVRVLIEESGDILRKRYQPLDALKNREPDQTAFKKNKVGDTVTKLLTKDGHRVVLQHEPFRVDLYAKDKLVQSINSENKLFFEKYKKKVLLSDREKGFWEESFGDHKDTKPHGSSSVGVDIAFFGMKYVYGIPEHAESYALRDTKNYEPYRLYNLDVFEYELNNPMALYGSIPYLVGASRKRTAGLLWLNAAETWVDVETSSGDKGALKTILTDQTQKAREVVQINTHFMSESGIIDLFVLLGPHPKDTVRQLAELTGVYPLPPLFSLGYHQSRWNYNDQKDLLEVHENFDKHGIPIDVLWLDIEHTDGKRYFTWDKEKFPEPEKMIDELSKKGRKLVTIVDPHIRRDLNYSVYKNAKKNSFFIKNADGETIFEGNCWPGDSSYLDFTNPKVREYWSTLFSFEKYPGTTEDVFIWNDMNEPSVFSGPEITLPKDTVHAEGLEHREVHNIYGFYHHQATFEGLKKRTQKDKRPFVLTRSFFVGSQRTAAVWTGDNKADWSHLKASIPMTLSLSTAGIPHVGADVGGFFGDPDEELLVRWYQTGAFQPFFRGHAHQDTKRREPWLFADSTKNAIAESIKFRYQLLPYWYTLFYEHTKTGLPVIRPFWLEFSADESSYDEDRQWMIGNALLVKPVMEPSAQIASIYLPGQREVWYDWHTSKARPSPGAVQSNATLTSIPLYQRGGTIVPIVEAIGGNANAARNEPVTLYIALNQKGDFANGTIYLDDGETHAYERGEYAYWGITFKRVHDYLHTITNKNLDTNGKLDSEVFVEKIVIRGAKFYPRTAHVFIDDFTPEPVDFEYDRETFVMEITTPTGYITSEFRLDLHS